jgi:hypothetical protein
MGPKWSDPVRAVILRAESALLPAVGGDAGWSSTRSSRCGKDPGPKRDPRGRSWSVQWFLRESAFLPVVGEALGGSSTRSSRCGTSPLLHSPPQHVRPVFPPPYDSRPPQAQSGQCGSPQAGPGYRWQERDSESFDSPGQLPQHASRLPKLFNLDCTVGMGEYLARGTMGTSPVAYGIGGQGWRAVHGHLGLATRHDPTGLAFLEGASART